MPRGMGSTGVACNGQVINPPIAINTTITACNVRTRPMYTTEAGPIPAIPAAVRAVRTAPRTHPKCNQAPLSRPVRTRLLGQVSSFILNVNPCNPAGRQSLCPNPASGLL